MSFGTTRKQAELLAFLREKQNAGGLSPSYDEMAEAVGLHSKSGIARMVAALVVRGALRHMPGHARSIEVVEVDPHSAIDAGTEQQLRTYCHVTGLTRRSVVTVALREYFRAHPIPQAAGDKL